MAKTLLDYSEQLSHIPPRRLAREINKARVENGELYMIAIPNNQGLKVNGDRKLEKTSEKTEIQFYDYLILDESKFMDWAKTIQGSSSRTISEILLSSKDILELAKDPEKLKKYLSELELAKGGSKAVGGLARESWASFYAGHSDLLKGEDSDAIQAALDKLTPNLSGKGGYKGSNRIKGLEFKSQLEERLAEIESD